MNSIKKFKYSTWAESIQPSIMQKMLERTNSKDMISFALGLPDPNLFPIAEYKKSIDRIIDSTPKLFQYAPPLASLKRHIVKLMASRQVKCTEAQVFITGGAQQAISLLSRLLLEQGGTLATGSITYPGFLQVVTPFCPEIIGVPIELGSGLCLDTLEKVFSDRQHAPAYFYIVPDGHNPLGISLSTEQKRCVADLARKYNIPVIEDDCYGFLNYEALSKPIRAYEDQWVFYIGSFSKILSPAFRTGWIIVPEEMISKLSFTKEAFDINTASFGHIIIDDLLNRDILDSHLDTLRIHYKERRDIMVQTIKSHFPANTKISEPENGFFIWVELGNGINTTCLLHKALDNSIAFVPSEEFACNSEYKTYNGMRLNFSHCTPSMIKKGIEKL